MTSRNHSLGYAASDEHAKARFERAVAADPFPDIPPALLNSADIADYVAATGMIYPFYPEQLKPSSYGVKVRGKCVLWSADGEKITRVLSRTPIPEYRNLLHVDDIRVPSNSIVFLTLEPQFRLPQYISARFNLTIKHVYSGYLMGTGPLVDAGFEGRLSFPLHNLTDNDYWLFADEEMVWIEFTKVSPRPEWLPAAGSGHSRSGEYVKFPERKRDRRDVDDYLVHAAGGSPIASSIPGSIKKTEEAARLTAKIAYAGGLAAAISVAALVYNGFQLVSSVQQNVSTVAADLKASSGVAASKEDLRGLQTKIHEMELELAKLSARSSSEVRLPQPESPPPQPGSAPTPGQALPGGQPAQPAAPSTNP